MHPPAPLSFLPHLSPWPRGGAIVTGQLLATPARMRAAAVQKKKTAPLGGGISEALDGDV